MFKKLFLHSKGRYISATTFGIIIIILNNILNKSWLLIDFVNGFFIAGFADILLAGLSFVSSFGFFDMFTYIFAKKGPEIKSLYDYSVVKNKKRAKKPFIYMPYIAFGILFLLITLILYLIFKSIY